MRPSVGPDFFNDIFARDVDPWGFDTSAYERDKYADTLANLPREHYRSGIELGCATGVLSGFLAERCDRLVGIDFAEVALAEARRRHAGRTDLTFERLHLPHEAPSGSFDLIVLSEILYFMNRADVGAMAKLVRGIAEPGATLILVHWLGQSADHLLSGDEAAEAFTAAAARFAKVARAFRREGYRLDVLAVAGVAAH